MELTNFQNWLCLAALALLALYALRIGSRDAVEHTSRRRQELEVLYEPTAGDNSVSPSARRSNHVVECVFASQSFADITIY